MNLYALFSTEAAVDDAIAALEQQPGDAEWRVIRTRDAVGQGKILAVPQASGGMLGGLPAVLNADPSTAQLVDGLDEQVIAYLDRQLKNGAVVLAIESDEPQAVEALLTQREAEVWRA